MIEHSQQFGLVGMQPSEQAIEGDETGAAAEDAIETGTQLAAPARCRVAAVGFQVGVEPPDQRADSSSGRPLCGRLVRQKPV